jgi:hypothetical protein
MGTPVHYFRPALQNSLAAFSLTPEAESAANNNGKRATSSESAQHVRMFICSTNLAKPPNQHRAFREPRALQRWQAATKGMLAAEEPKQSGLVCLGPERTQ